MSSKISKFFRKKKEPKGDIVMKIIDWHSMDEVSMNCDSDSDDSNSSGSLSKEYVMRAFGATKSGDSITVKITGFTPFYYIKVPDEFSERQLHQFTSFVDKHYILKSMPHSLLPNKCLIVKSKDIYGFNNGKIFKYIKLVFVSYSSMMRSRYIFKDPIFISGITSSTIKFKLYESNFEPFMRYTHIQGILMAGWIKIPQGKYEKTFSEATTQIEIVTDHKNVQHVDDMSPANFLQASYDIETYSVDGTFPKPHIKDNVVFQIATTYKFVKTDRVITHLLTLKKCTRREDDVSNDIYIEEFETEKDLIKCFVKTMKGMGPDVAYTYNGDNFDNFYLVERSKLLGIEQYFLSGMSRLTNVQAILKKEFFSSSAYGDSEFFRLYSPGMLGYDLLIHFKRGMKKYSSYKLDNIAYLLMGKNKNPVTVKEIFDFYANGNPDEIRCILDYCMVDTSLLIDLVDNQLILSSITQLANVTYVPISYLLTRGQTIKTLSQIYRMARQMNYLVPHTNFNEDDHHSVVTLNKEFFFKEGDFIKIHMGVKKSSGVVEKMIQGNKLAIRTNSELIDLDLGECKLEYKTKTFKITDILEMDVDSSFSGATVLTATPKFTANNVSVLDFASLYPTIMISSNLCFSTFVMNEKYLGYEGVKYENIAWDDKIEYKISQHCDAVMATGKRKGETCGKQAFFSHEVDIVESFNSTKNVMKYFCRVHDPLKKTRPDEEKFQKKDVSFSFNVVQVGPNGENKGVVPTLLEELYSTRKLVKKQMGQAQREGNYELAKILDANQLAIKVSLNSTYGFLGRKKGNLILQELGSIVTYTGRTLIKRSKEYTEGEFMDYVKESGILTHTLRKRNLNDMSGEDKDAFLRQHKQQRRM